MLKIKRYDYNKREVPPGKSINLGDPKNVFDDCCYEPLPSPNYPEIKTLQYYESITRLLFHLIVYMNMCEEAAPFKLDEAKVQLYLDVKRFMADQFHDEVPLRYHLYPDEITQLFGSHNILEARNKEPTHQRCHHVDCLKFTEFP